MSGFGGLCNASALTQRGCSDENSLFVIHHRPPSFRSLGEQVDDVSQGDVYDDGRLRVEHDQFHVTWDGELMRLTLKEFLLFSYLVRNTPRVVQASTLWNIGWGPNIEFSHTGLRTHIYRIRKLVDPLGMEIETVVNIGYRFLPHGNLLTEDKD